MKSNSKSMVKKVFACFLSLALVLTLTPTLPTSANVAKAQDAAGTPTQTMEQGGSNIDSGTPYSGAGTGKTAAEIDAELQQKIDALEGSSENSKDSLNEGEQNGNSSGQINEGEVSKPSTVTAPLGAPVSDAASGVCKVFEYRTSTTTYYATIEDAITAVNASTSNSVSLYIYKSTTLSSVCNITNGNNVWIENISDPASDAENPTKNGSTDAQPIVTFAAGAQLNFTATNAGDQALYGVVFDGGNVERTTPAITNSKPNLFLRKGGSNSSAGITGINATFRNFNNTTGEQASVIQNTGGLYIENADFTNNGNTGNTSSAIYNNGGTIKYAHNSGSPSMSNNKSGNGGAIFQTSGSIEISGGTISGNEGSYGGAICQEGGSIEISGGTISDNEGGSGGAIFSDSASLTITDGIISNNEASAVAGALYLSNCTFNMSGGIIKDNSCSYCSAIYFHTPTATTFSGGEITGNKSVKDPSDIEGAVHIFNGGSVTFSGSVKIHDNGFASSKTANITELANFHPNSASEIKVGSLNSDAKVGVYSNSTLCDKGVTFANVSSGTATSVADSLKKVFTNDAHSNYYAIPADTSGTGIKWAEGVCKVVDEVAGVQLFSTISEAVTYLGTVSDFSTSFASNSGTAKIEVLVPEVTQTSTTTIDLGASKPIMLTTASPEATDGYPYLGDTSVEEGRAVIKRGFSGTTSDYSGSIFNFSNSSIFTLKEIVIDGNKDAYSSDTTNIRRVFYISGSSAELVLDSKSEIRNSDSGGNTARGGAICADSAAESSKTKIEMRTGSKITGCTATEQGGAVATRKYADFKMEGAEVSGCRALYGAALSFSFTQGSTATIKDSLITGSVATGENPRMTNDEGGGTIRSFCNLTISGNTAITGNTSKAPGSAIYMNADSGAIDDAYLTIEDTVTISDNTSTKYSGAKGTALYYEYAEKNKIILAGSPKVTGNIDSSGNEANVYEGTSEDDGGMIRVSSAGLGSGANVGIYSENNAKEGDVFAKIGSDSLSATTIANFRGLTNDQNATLMGRANDDATGVLWSTAYEDPTESENEEALSPSEISKLGDNVSTGDDLANLLWVLIGAGAFALAIAYVANKKRMANKMSHMKHAK